MSKKKKTKKRKADRPLEPARQAALEAWLARLDQDPEEAFQGLAETAGSDPGLALAMVQGLGGSDASGAGGLALRAEQELKPKALRKEAKKSLYRLRQRGVEVREEEAGSAIFKPARLEPPFGFISGYYPDQTQTLSLAFPMSGGEGFCGAAVCHFQKGIVQIGMAPMGLGKFRRMNQEMSREMPWPQVRIEGDDLAYVLARVLENHRAGMGAMGQEIMFISQWLEGLDQVPEKAPLYARLGVEPEPGQGYGPRLAELLEEPPCLWWYPEEELWEPAQRVLNDKEGSDLILSPDLEAEKEEERLAVTSEILFPEDSWPAWQNRLEETALYLAGNGQEDEARVFLRAAADLDGPDHPLFKALVGRMERLTQDRDQAQEEESEALVTPAGTGLILPPGLDKAGS